MNWFGKSLHHKFTLATIAGFLVSSLVFLGLFLTFYQNELEQERAQAARDVNRLLQSSLENAMLKRDLPGLVFIINRLGEEPNINGVMITDPKGKIRFSTQAEDIDKMLEKELIQSSEPSTLFIQDESGIEVLRSINPVHNKSQCKECHGTVEQNPINGILVVDYVATSIKNKARNTTLMLMGAGALIVVINLLGGWWFIRRFILRPVESLSAASRSLSHGRLDTCVNLPGKDELALLGETFNMMGKNLQSSMREQEEGRAFLQSMVDAIPDGLRIIDENYNMLLVNRTFREQTGRADKPWVGEKCYYAAYNLDEPCATELTSCPLDIIRKDQKSIKLIHHHKRFDGKSLDVEVFAAPMTILKEGKEGKEVTLIVESIRDLSKQVRFSHEQRLSELGRLAAGVAHEIYNPMSSMKIAMHTVQTMLQNEAQYDDIEKYLNVVAKEMDQCIQITDRLLRLSASPAGQLELVDMHVAVKDILSLVKWDANDASITLNESFPQQPLRVFAHESEMRMLILNLVQNAFHAMPNGGVLNISGSLEGGDVVIKFEDTGIGIPAEFVSKIFTPFFSRRADDIHGTGLGLPISRSIVQNLEGSLDVESEVGKGSCFIVRIPEATAERLTS